MNPTPYQELASVIEDSTSSQAAREWLADLDQRVASLPLAPEPPYNLHLPTGSAQAGHSYTYMAYHVVRDATFTPLPQSILTSPLPLQNSQSVYLQFSLDAVASQLCDLRADIHRRAVLAFTTALSLGVLGGGVLLVGIGLAFAGYVAIGVTASVAGILSSSFSKNFAVIYRTENTNLGQTIANLRRFEDVRLQLWVTDHIGDPNRRDEAIKEIAKHLRSRKPGVGSYTT